MKTSPAGIDLIKRFEGLELEAYQDIAGVWTIGYGHTGPDVEPGMRISERDAEELLRRDLRPREDAVNRLVSVPLNQNEFDALVSFVYNVGVEGFRRSTVRRRLNGGNRVGAAEALTWWNKATIDGVLREVTGLTRRRAAERALFLTPVNPPLVKDPAQVDENSRVAPSEDPPRRGSLGESRTLQGAGVAGGAGATAATMGRDSSEELDDLESRIEDGAPPVAGDDDESDVTVFDPIPGRGDGAAFGDGTTEEVAVDPARPSKHEKHAVEAQVQFALLTLIVLAVLYVVFARIDDWLRYRR